MDFWTLIELILSVGTGTKPTRNLWTFGLMLTYEN